MYTIDELVENQDTEIAELQTEVEILERMNEVGYINLGYTEQDLEAAKLEIKELESDLEDASEDTKYQAERLRDLAEEISPQKRSIWG
jgi:hypothetical protein